MAVVALWVATVPVVRACEEGSKSTEPMPYVLIALMPPSGLQHPSVHVYSSTHTPSSTRIG